MANRKLDVDVEDEDQYDAAAAVAVSADEVARVSAEVDSRVNDVRTFLQRGDVTNAVITAIANPPSGGFDRALVEKNSSVAIEALAAARPADVTAIVAKLDPEQIDVLAKYIYKGMEKPEVYNASTLLIWHEKLIDVGGVQTVVKTLVDKKTIV